MKNPNFFIVGAPRCGTTALSKYLRTHPRIYMSDPKEPYFFSKDLRLGDIDSEMQYMKCFKKASAQHMAVGEASAGYLYSSIAIPNILEFNPEAKFIVMLRNPIDMVHSLHSLFLYSCDEDVENFREAWNLQGVRKKGRNIPKRCNEPKILQYGEFAKLGQQLERLYEVVPKDRVMVILFEDFVIKPKLIYEDVLRFLGVPLDSRSEFPVINANKVWKSKVAGNFWSVLINLRVFHYARNAKRFFGLGNKDTAVWLMQVNTKNQKRPLIPKDLKKELAEYFKKDVGRISALIRRDCTHWVKN